MQFKKGDHVRFIKDCFIFADDRGCIIKNIFHKGTVAILGADCDENDMYIGGYKIPVGYLEVIKRKEQKDKHNILADLIQPNGNVDGEKLMDKLESQSKKDAIHPDYYKFHGYDVFDIADYFGLSFPLGNGLKYLLRAGKKDKDKTIQDLEKCVECVQREIKFLKEK